MSLETRNRYFIPAFSEPGLVGCNLWRIKKRKLGSAVGQSLMSHAFTSFS